MRRAATRRETFLERPANASNPRVAAAVYAGLTDSARPGLRAKLAVAFGG